MDRAGHSYGHNLRSIHGECDEMWRSDASTSIKMHVDMTIDEVCHRSYEASTSNKNHAVSMDAVCHRSTEQKKHQTTTENAAAWEVVRDVEGQRVRKSPVEMALSSGK